MKLLGKYICEQGFEYKNLIEQAGIICRWEEVKSGLVNFNSRGKGRSPSILIFVNREDFDKALSIIKKRKSEQQIAVNQISTTLDQKFLMVCIAFIALFGLLIWVGIQQGWW